MDQTTHSKPVEHQSGAEIEDEIGELSSQLAQKTPDRPAAAAPEESRWDPLDSPCLAAALLTIAVGLTIFNLFGPGFSSANENSSIVHESDDPLREMLLFAYEEVDVYWDENGRLPHRLEEIGLTEDFNVILTPTGSDTYTLTATQDETSLSYRSDQDPAVFFGKLWADE